MKNVLFLISCLLILSLAPAIAQDFVTLRQVTMLDDDKSSLTEVVT